MYKVSESLIQHLVEKSRHANPTLGEQAMKTDDEQVLEPVRPIVTMYPDTEALFPAGLQMSDKELDVDENIVNPVTIFGTDN